MGGPTRKSWAPRITNFSRLDTSRVGKTDLQQVDLIFLTTKQLRTALAKAEVAKELPEHASGLGFIPIAPMGYMGVPLCISSDPDTNCYVVSGPGPRDEPVWFYCVCDVPREKKEIPDLPKFKPNFELPSSCSLKRPSTKMAPKFQCVGVNCNKCVLRILLPAWPDFGNVPGYKIVVWCECTP